MRINKAEVSACLPPFRNKVRIATWGQSTDDIADEIVKAHEQYEDCYDKIYQFFDTGDVYSTCSALWDFCKYQLVYTAERSDEQSVKSPSAILKDGQKVDCKHYSLFIAGVLDALRRNEGDTFDLYYRLVSEKKNKQIGHVFPVAVVSGKEIWIDPVMAGFNQRCSWTNIEDVEIMPVYSISGVQTLSKQKTSNTVTVDKSVAQSNFFKMVNLDLFNIRELLLSDDGILYGPVKNYFKNNGLNFNQLLLILGKSDAYK